MQASSTVRSAFDLRNCPVKDAAGKSIGRLRDIVFFANQGVVSYAVIGFGGVLGIGERHVAMPWTKLRISPNGKFLEVDEIESRSSSRTLQAHNGHASKRTKSTQRSKQIERTATRTTAAPATSQPPKQEDALIYKLFYKQDVAANGRLRHTNESQQRAKKNKRSTSPARTCVKHCDANAAELPVPRVRKQKAVPKR